MIVLMILTIASAVAATYFFKEEYTAAGTASVFITLVLFIGTIAAHYDDVAVGKVKGMKEAGMKPLTNEQIYQMSQKELDKCNVVHTFSKTYYFSNNN